ncbi:hypothetical protein LAZ67_19000253 [Cordylochernes scorpioides]|uniref:Reverse transcriptase domain-containing protein n=1 Tax=Cordylochernes scorpioides TaxID=51811 RepID=A0ABY6LHX2_9ARAC|nr:hypothetical protein LAZ67_19000253 [Cordylochernes scorpioides]
MGVSNEEPQMFPYIFLTGIAMFSIWEKLPYVAVVVSNVSDVFVYLYHSSHPYFGIRIPKIPNSTKLDPAHPWGIFQEINLLDAMNWTSTGIVNKPRKHRFVRRTTQVVGDFCTWDSWNLLGKRYTTLINFNKKKYLQEKQELLKNARDSANFWKTIATLKDKSYIQGNITILEWQCFYNKLLSAETTIGSDLSTLSRIDPELYCEISITEITREISSLANEKACGADEIPNEALKTLPFEHLVTLKNIFNRIINSGSYPLIWSKSIIHPIFKSGDRDNPSNYRGIALISNLSKLFTSILKSRLRNWIEGRSIIPENQAGFRKGYSCQDHIFTLLSLIQLTLRRKRRKLYAFFVDLKKAFDTVPHSLLWSKLGELGLDFRFVNLIRNYFEQMTTTVRWNGLFTEPIKIRSGVLQGEPLSPYLFILFVTDLINIFNDSTLPGIYLPNFGTVHLLMYADDIILIGESKINLQIKINMLKKYFETNHLTLNESKSKIMVFRNGGRPAKSDKWFWGDQLLTVTSKYLYLGYPLTTTISFSQVASYFKGKALAATGEVWKIMEKSRLNSFGSSMKLLDSIILSTLLYSAPIWANEKYKILDQIQNNYLRRLLNLPSNTPGYILRMETGRFSLGVTATKLILKFWLRILKMEKSRLPAICLAQLWETSTLTNAFIELAKYPFLINQEKLTTDAFRAVGPHQRGASCTSTTKKLVTKAS